MLISTRPIFKKPESWWNLRKFPDAVLPRCCPRITSLDNISSTTVLFLFVSFSFFKFSLEEVSQLKNLRVRELAPVPGSFESYYLKESTFLNSVITAFMQSYFSFYSNLKKHHG
jgi:hypothetical protein